MAALPMQPTRQVPGASLQPSCSKECVQEETRSIAPRIRQVGRLTQVLQATATQPQFVQLSSGALVGFPTFGPLCGDFQNMAPSTESKRECSPLKRLVRPAQLHTTSERKRVRESKSSENTLEHSQGCLGTRARDPSCIEKDVDKIAGSEMDDLHSPLPVPVLPILEGGDESALPTDQSSLNSDVVGNAGGQTAEPTYVQSGPSPQIRSRDMLEEELTKCATEGTITQLQPAAEEDVKSISSESSDEGYCLHDGLIDIYRNPQWGLFSYRPRQARSSASCPRLEVYANPLRMTCERLRKSIETVLHIAWNSDNEAKLAISHLLGLHLNGMNLRSGTQMPRCEMRESSKGGHWLIWEEMNGGPQRSPADPPAVGALVLRRQGPRRKRKGGIVIDYISAIRDRGGRGWPMVLAAEVICRLEGVSVLYSAADLSQDGRYMKNTRYSKSGGSSALDAHHRWGFIESSATEWKSVGLEVYDETRCCVSYTKKYII